MAWEYLDTDNFKIRFEITKALLGSIEWKDIPLNIVDLNCGEKSSLYCSIRSEQWSIKYYGNDILCKDFSEEDAKIECVSDEEVVDRIGKFLDKVNVLCLLGDGAGEHTGEKVESITSLDSFFKIIDKYNPEYIIYETISAFERKFGRITNVNIGINNRGYSLKYSLGLQILDADYYIGNRRFLLFEKKS